jgi:hypothetical protein
MSQLRSEADIIQGIYDSYVSVFGEAPSRFDCGARIYADLHVNEPIGRVMALQWMDDAVCRMGLNERKFMKTQKPDECRDYSIGEIRDMIAKEARSQGLLAA